MLSFNKVYLSEKPFILGCYVVIADLIFSFFHFFNDIFLLIFNNFIYLNQFDLSNKRRCGLVVHEVIGQGGESSSIPSPRVLVARGQRQERPASTNVRNR